MIAMQTKENAPVNQATSISLQSHPWVFVICLRKKSNKRFEEKQNDNKNKYKDRNTL